MERFVLITLKLMLRMAESKSGRCFIFSTRPKCACTFAFIVERAPAHDGYFLAALRCPVAGLIMQLNKIN